MARLFAGEKEHRRNDVLRLLWQHEFGLSEAEIAQILGWDRRTANNYLRRLAKDRLAYKERRLWLPEE